MTRPDPQARRVTVMERRAFGGHLEHKTPLRWLRRIATRACCLHEVPKVSVSIRRCHGAGGWYDPDGVFIYLDSGEQNALSLAHELAHHITAHKHPHAQDHGPAWVRWYAHLLDAWRLVPIEGTVAACRRYGVAIAPVIVS
jgi:hypothetical protein